ncbi:hypothetical protein [Rouxiella sp. Mn2063]|uniref:hypothetical protein n=1 Tax=Rouxiella sp. Mn2063 TaxID=3395262 RepID=UPI003BD61181
MNILDFIGSSLVNADNFYIKPNIPKSKIINAINSFCPDLSSSDILIIVDDTVFGSAKNGLVITNNGVYAKGQMAKPLSFTFNDKTIFFVEKKVISVSVYLNDIELINTTQPSYKDLNNLFNKLNDFILSKFSVESQIAPTPVPTPVPTRVPTPVPTLGPAPSKKTSLYRTLPNDGFINGVRVSKGVDSFFGFFDDEKNKTAGEFVRHEVNVFLSKTIIYIRNEYVDKNNIHGLKNDVTTLESIIYALAVLRLEMNDRYVNENQVNFILSEGLTEHLVVGKNGRDRNVVSHFINISNSLGDDLDSITASLYLRLFLGNFNGKVVGEDMSDSIDIVMERFFNEEMISEVNSQDELFELIMGSMVVESINEIGDLTMDRKITRDAQACVDRILDKIHM